MAGLRFRALAHKPTVVLDMTSLTLDEFHHLMPIVDTAFHAYLAEWRLDGKPRTSRKPSIYTNCPLPTPEDRLLFILVYLKTNPLQVAHGLMFGLPQGKANQWIHVLLPSVQHALQQRGDAPSRTLEALANQFAAPASAAADAPVPLFVTTAPNDASHAPKMALNRKATIAARKSATP